MHRLSPRLPCIHIIQNPKTKPYFEGSVWSCGRQSPDLFTAIGECLGRIDAALASFLPSVVPPPIAGPWDLRSAAATVSAHLGRFAGADKR